MPGLREAVAEVELGPRPLLGIGDAELEGGPERPGRILIRGGSHVVISEAEVERGRLARSDDGGREGEMVGELGQNAGGLGPVDALECLAHEEVELGAPDDGDPVVDRPSHELVGEPTRPRRLRQLLEEPVADGGLDGADQCVPFEPGRLSENAQLELPPGYGGDLDGGRRVGRQPGEALLNHVAEALGDLEAPARPD